MKDLQWVEAFHPGIFFFFYICLFLCCTKYSQSCQLLSIFVSVVLSNISQYTLKHEHLTTLSRTPTHRTYKKWPHLLQIWNCCTILSCQWEPMNPLCTSDALPPETDAWKQSTQTWKQFDTSTRILYSHGANCIFYCFVAQWFFTRMLIWHFNKLCERLQCCGGIAPIRLTADPLAGPLSP